MLCFLVLANCSHFTDEGMDTQRPPPQASRLHTAPWVWWDPNSDLPDPKVSVSKWFGSSGRHSFLFPQSGIKTWKMLRKWEFIWSFKTVSQGYFTLFLHHLFWKYQFSKLGKTTKQNFSSCLNEQTLRSPILCYTGDALKHSPLWSSKANTG